MAAQPDLAAFDSQVTLIGVSTTDKRSVGSAGR